LKSARDFKKCVGELTKRSSKKRVYVNHFSIREEQKGDAPYSESLKYMDFLYVAEVNYVLFGHTHRESDYGICSTLGTVTFVNGGSDYDNPKVKMIEL
jgi:UDP-2,3-diacylglucosamine pyrophosphatase LpxH